MEELVDRHTSTKSKKEEDAIETLRHVVRFPPAL